MNIAVVDVAAESSGALSVLNDFYKYIKKRRIDNIQWFFFTSVVSMKETENIVVIENPKVKKGWFHRIVWEYTDFKRYIKKYNIDLILSLQNKALPIKEVFQIVYFHNALHFINPNSFSFFNKKEREIFLYRMIVTPITFWSFKYCNILIAQTEEVKKALAKKVNGKKIYVAHPDINIEIHSGINHIQGFIYPAGPRKYKNHKIIIEAVRKLGNEFEGEILFTFVGDENEYARDIKKVAVGLENIKFIGFVPRDQLLKKYENYGLIFSSEFESFPIPFVEAMAYGTPILAKDMPYAKEILKEYKNSFLYEDLDELVKLFQNLNLFKRDIGVKVTDASGWGKILNIIKGIPL